MVSYVYKTPLSPNVKAYWKQLCRELLELEFFMLIECVRYELDGYHIPASKVFSDVVSCHYAEMKRLGITFSK